MTGVLADYLPNRGIASIAQFATISALRSNTTAYTSAVVEGYSSQADGGDGVFIYVASDTTSADNGGTIIVDASARRWHRQVGAHLTPEMFGAKADGSTDNNTSLANFFAALQSMGREGKLKTGTYNVSTGFSFTTSIKLTGTGSTNSIIFNTNAALNTPIINIPNLNGVTLRDFAVHSVTGVGSGCAAIQLAGGQNFNLEALDVSGTYNGIAISAVQTGAWMKGCFAHNVASNGFYVVDGNMTVQNCNAVNCGSSGFAFVTASGSAGLIVDGCTAYACSVCGFFFQGSASAKIQDLVVSNCVGSTNSGQLGSFYFDTYGGGIVISNLFSELAGLNGSLQVVTPSTVGISITANNTAISMSNLNVTFSASNGIQIECDAWSLSGASLFTNNISGNGEAAGLLIGGGRACANFCVSGVNTAVPTGQFSSQSFGINCFTSGSTGIVTTCVLHGNAGAFQNSGNTVTFAGNLSV